MPSRWQSNPFRPISGPISCGPNWNGTFFSARLRVPIVQPAGRGVTGRHGISLIGKPNSDAQAGMG